MGIPQGFATTFIPYKTVDKRDREPNAVRFMFISPEAADAESDRVLPEGTQIVINQWLRQFNHVRPHQALGMRPPVPETI